MRTGVDAMNWVCAFIRKIKMKKILRDIRNFKSADAAAIKKAYRKKALEHHPDKILETNRQKKSSR
jgi:DnaJ-domain-containing protein 1